MLYTDVIERVKRVVEPQGVMSVQLAASYTAASGTATFDTTSPMFPAILAGSIVAIGTNLLYIYENPNSGTGVTSVIGGYGGSTDVNAANNSLCEVNPRFPRFDIAKVINEELYALASPGISQLGQVLTVDITYIPAFMGYDLGANFDGQRSKVLEVSYKEPNPLRRYPLIRRGDYRVIRDQSDTGIFPNGNGIILYEPAYPGLPIHVQHLAPFTQLVNLTDDLSSVAGVPPHMQDIVYLGSIVRLVPDREIARQNMGRQPDPRKAPEVVAGAIKAAAGDAQRRYEERRSEESGFLKRAYRQSEGW